MAFIVLDYKKLESNFNYLDNLFKEKGIQWAIVSKVLCGNKNYLTLLQQFKITQICDSRVSNLKMLKELNPDIETIYIKPPAKRAIKGIVKYADISMNTEIKTIQLLNDEACNQNKMHKIIIMIEMGELREGVMRDDVIDFYYKVFNLSNIEVVGVGTNLSCMYGVLPNQDKLIQLSLYCQLIEEKFHKKLKYVSGGASVTIPLIFKKLLPKEIKHFRVGETLFLGTDVYNNTTLENMNPDVFVLYSEIIELIKKPVVPMGERGTNLEGDSFSFDDILIGKTSYRAIIDVGLLDVGDKHITPLDETVSIVGVSSDMFVMDIGDNKNNYKAGDLIAFKVDYMGLLRLMHSKYIDKKIRK